MKFKDIENEIVFLEKKSLSLEWILYNISYNTIEFIEIREKFDKLNIYLKEIKEKFELNKLRIEKLKELNDIWLIIKKM